MKRIFSLTILVLALGFLGCAGMPTCPPENNIVMTPRGLVTIPKGLFDNEIDSETGERNYMPEAELDKIMEDFAREMRKSDGT